MVITHSPRETREGWPLLNVETEVNGDSKWNGPVLLAAAAKLGIGQERGTRDKPSQ